jgi:uncharacterized membrane protein HdeD (DUF308 family)
MTTAELMRQLWSLVLLRGVLAMALGVTLFAIPTTGAAGVTTRVAAYWVVDGAVVVWAATIARRHGFGGWSLLIRGIVPVLVGLWILGSPLSDALGGSRVGSFTSLLVLIPLLLVIVTFHGVLAGLVDVVTWLVLRRELAGDASALVSAVLAVGTTALIWRALLGVEHRYVAAALTTLAGAAFLIGAFRLHASRSRRGSA